MDVGVVVIGRNEGIRLRKCLESVVDHAASVIYVDSGSSDGSVDMAGALGVEVVQLDMRLPFTAARARNEGFGRLRAAAPNLHYVQFVDGDCEVVSGWWGPAVSFLDGNARVAVVCGRRRERFPAHSVYNMLCDIEWDTPIGEAKSCGGDSMMRVEAFESVCGFREDLIAGEEPELCVRLRAAGWGIWRIGVEMTSHDAAISRFSQWWKRNVRSGYAFAQGVDLHGTSPERYCVRESRSIWFWGLGLPVITLVGALSCGPIALIILLLYPVQVVRIAAKGRRSRRENWWRAAFLVLGKFPEMVGQVKFLSHRYTGRVAALIEYK